ncbi:hypothetical protein VB713_27395 [Anabaena cylindrica UHCC 0172]|nr:hypothetical protein [Anabaena cylindrica UHCC 0172]
MPQAIDYSGYRTQPPNFKRSHPKPQHPQTAIPSVSASLSHTTPILNELLAAALRYRSPNLSPNSDTFGQRFAIAHNHPNFA